MMKDSSLLLLSALLLLSVGCSASNAPTAYPVSPIVVRNAPYPGSQGTVPGLTLQASPEPPKDAPLPQPGKASISGVLYSFTLPHVLGNTLFYLTSAVGTDRRQMPNLLIGPEDKKGDIRGYTNARGQFALDNIPSGNYYLIVGVPYNWIPAVISGEDETPQLIELYPSQRKPLGIVLVPWP